MVHKTLTENNTFLTTRTHYKTGQESDDPNV